MLRSRFLCGTGVWVGWEDGVLIWATFPHGVCVRGYVSLIYFYVHLFACRFLRKPNKKCIKNV